MATKRRGVLLSVITLVLCLSLVAVGTYALFSDSVTLTNHLQAGKLDVTLMRTNLVTNTLDKDTGFLVEKTIGGEENFSNTTTNTANVFGLTSESLIVPYSEYTATMKIVNEADKSDVAFHYWVEIRFDDKDDLALADQLKVTVTAPGGKTISSTLAEGKDLGDEKNPIGTLARGKAAEFTVSVLFDHSDDNNSAQGQQVNFDLIVHAVQALKDPDAKPPVTP